jgi:hypothetical protein
VNNRVRNRENREFTGPFTAKRANAGERTWALWNLGRRQHNASPRPIVIGRNTGGTYLGRSHGELQDSKAELGGVPPAGSSPMPSVMYSGAATSQPVPR